MSTETKSTESTPRVLEDLASFDSLIADTKDKLIVIDFWASWCGPCIHIAPWFKEQAAKYPDVIFAKVDVDENDEASAKAKISCMPTFKVYWNSECVKTVEGADKDALEKCFTLDSEGISKMQEEEAKAQKVKEENDKLVAQLATSEEFSEFTKSDKITVVSFYVEGYKPECDNLLKAIHEAAKEGNDSENSIVEFTDRIRKVNLEENGQLGNEHKVRGLPWINIYKNSETHVTLKDSEATLENIVKYLKMSDEEYETAIEEIKKEQARLAKLVPQLDDYEEYKKLVIEGNELVVVDYYATWCGPCINFAPTFMKMAGDLAPLKFIKIDCDKNTEAKKHAGLNCFPTFKIWKNGKELAMCTGASEAKLREAIEMAQTAAKADQLKIAE